MVPWRQQHLKYENKRIDQNFNAFRFHVGAVRDAYARRVLEASTNQSPALLALLAPRAILVSVQNGYIF